MTVILSRISCNNCLLSDVNIGQGAARYVVRTLAVWPIELTSRIQVIHEVDVKVEHLVGEVILNG